VFWKIYFDSRAYTRRAVDENHAVVLANDAVNHGHAQTRALTGAFGREERFENPFQHLRSNAFPSIGHRQTCVTSGLEPWMFGSKLLVHLSRLQLHGQAPLTLSHRMGRVGTEVHDYLVN